MTRPPRERRAWAVWLASDQCLPWLLAQARHIQHRAGALGLSAQVWPHPPLEGLPAAQRETALQEVAHEFWLYLRTQVVDQAQPWPAEALGADGPRDDARDAYLRRGFLLRLLSRARQKSAGLYRHLYRRLREEVSAAPDFACQPHPWGMLYGLRDQAPALTNLGGLLAEPYDQWPWPGRWLPQQRFLRFQRDDLLALARWFWEQATERLGAPHSLPLRELVACLAAHYPALTEPEPVPADEPLRQAWPAASIPLAHSGLLILASRLVAQWDPVRRSVFCLVVCSGGLTLQAVADRLELSGPSHAKYQLDRACRDIQRFAETWPGVVPPPTDREFWTNFLECVAWVCKFQGEGRS